MSAAESRSRSRGRTEQMVSSGRGGAGNMRSPSRDAGPRTVDDGVSLPVERGRDIRPPAPNHASHTGRGGAGNVRSPSTGADARTTDDDAYEAQLIRDRRAADAAHTRSTGRGGFGNMANRDASRSRSRSRGPRGDEDGARRVQGGRGGAGNVYSVAGSTDEELERLRVLDEEDEQVRKAYDVRPSNGAVHSTGKGGAGNMTQGSIPSFESYSTNATERGESSPPATGFTSGRGGAGNFHSNSAPSGTNGGGDDRGRHHLGPVEALKDFARSISRSKSRDRS